MYMYDDCWTNKRHTKLACFRLFGLFAIDDWDVQRGGGAAVPESVYVVLCNCLHLERNQRIRVDAIDHTYQNLEVA